MKRKQRVAIDQREVQKKAAPYCHMAEGARARRQGSGLADCPYPLGTKAQKAWCNGWSMKDE